MSVVIETLVFCDGCGANCNGDDWDKPAYIIREKRQKYGGWIMRNRKDYCSDCAKRLGLLKAK